MIAYQMFVCDIYGHGCGRMLGSPQRALRLDVLPDIAGQVGPSSGGRGAGGVYSVRVSSTISAPDSKVGPRLKALLVLTVAYALLVVPVILSGRGGTNEAGDAAMYHEPVIETMVEQWPSPDIVNYRSTTSPGYHLLMAAVMKSTCCAKGRRSCSVAPRSICITIGAPQRWLTASSAKAL